MTPRNPLERLPQLVAEAVVTQIVNLIDVDDIIRRIDINAVVERIDVNRLMSRVDIDAVVAHIDVNAIAERIDVTALVDRVDVDAIAQRVNVNAIAERVDVNAIAGRVNVDDVAARVNVNAVADRVDVGRVLARAEFSEFVARSTSSMVTEFLDVLRRQVVAVDDLLDRLSRRQRRFSQLAVGPTSAVTMAASDPHNREGTYAGSFSRLTALTLDGFAAWGLFLLTVGGIQATLAVFLHRSPHLFHHGLFAVLAAVPFFFLYFAWQWSLTGRTVGMALVGLRVEAATGQRASMRTAAVRALVLPFSIGLLGLGLLGMFLRADRRALHDLAAGTCVVYDWNARAPVFHRRAAPVSHVA